LFIIGFFIFLLYTRVNTNWELKKYFRIADGYIPKPLTLAKVFFYSKQQVMQLSQKAIQEFKEICHKDYGVELSDATAGEEAVRFFNMMNSVYKPVPKNYYTEYKKDIRNFKTILFDLLFRPFTSCKK